MKRMKRILAGLLVAGMMLAVVGCGGGEEKTVTLRVDMSADMGVPASDTMILTAKGDTIQTLKEITEIDLADYDDESREAFIEIMDESVVAEAQGIDGVTCSSRTSGTVYTLELTIDCTSSSTIQAVVDADLLQIEGAANKLSLNATQSALESSGYEVVE